jgi:hypothetical protein|nr:MAG TPA: hypothetical protein [Caudoviricetes sp.]
MSDKEKLKELLARPVDHITNDEANFIIQNLRKLREEVLKKLEGSPEEKLAKIQKMNFEERLEVYFGE